MAIECTDCCPKHRYADYPFHVNLHVPSIGQTWMLEPSELVHRHLLDVIGSILCLIVEFILSTFSWSSCVSRASSQMAWPISLLPSDSSTATVTSSVLGAFAMYSNVKYMDFKAMIFLFLVAHICATCKAFCINSV